MNWLLFSRSGQASRGDVLRGALFLCICLFVIKASGRVGVELLAVLSLLGMVLWWMWYAVFAKGYRAAGRPPAMALLPMVAIIVPGFIIDGMVQSAVAPEATLALQERSVELVTELGLVGGAQALRETGLQDTVTEATAVQVGVVRALYSFAAAWLFARVMPPTVKADAFN